MNTHTPGPWTVTYGGWIEGPNGEEVVGYSGCGSHGAEWNDADFRLVLAAPDLLAALKAINDYSRDVPAVVQAMVDAAIAKATQP